MILVSAGQHRAGMMASRVSPRVRISFILFSFFIHVSTSGCTPAFRFQAGRDKLTFITIYKTTLHIIRYTPHNKNDAFIQVVTQIT